MLIIANKMYYNNWSNNPLVKKAQKSESYYINLANNAKSIIHSEVDDYENLTGFKIDNNWVNNLALHTQITIKNSHLSYVHGRILYSSLASYLTKSNEHTAINIFETGTARGFSSLCMAKCLSDFNITGKIITFDLIRHDQKMFWNCIDDHVGEKTRGQLLSPWWDLVEKYILFISGDTNIELSKIYINRIHFAFLDGAHSYSNIKNEVNYVKSKQIKGDIIVFDDYTKNQFSGLVKGIDEFCRKNNYNKKIIYNYHDRGYVIATKQ